jgi:DNA-binding GntR family transcriptional regulator
MSPMPIREAVRRLDTAGLVENIPHRGARVTELSINDLEEVYEVRLALEVLAIRHAASRFTAREEATARQRLDAMGRALVSRPRLLLTDETLTEERQHLFGKLGTSRSSRRARGRRRIDSHGIAFVPP